MTRFQKQVLLEEEARVQKEKEERMEQSKTGSGSPTLNAKHPKNSASYSETVKYKNEHETDRPNQCEFVDEEN